MLSPFTSHQYKFYQKTLIFHNFFKSPLNPFGDWWVLINGNRFWWSEGDRWCTTLCWGSHKCCLFPCVFPVLSLRVYWLPGYVMGESLLANFPLLMRFPIWVSSSSCAANLQASFKVGRVIFLAPQMPTQVWFHQELSWNSYWWCQRICIWNDPEYPDWQEWHVR